MVCDIHNTSLLFEKWLVYSTVKSFGIWLQWDRILLQHTVYIHGLFGGDLNLAVWQIFIGLPNLNHAVLTHTHEIN